jgi:AraC family transcriptional regulator
MSQTVRDFLGRSPVATISAQMDLGMGGTVAIWENHNDRLHYDNPQNHTFSLYLKGGTGVRRIDAGGIAGYPGALCIMPEGCGSEWEVAAPFRFVHLYLSDARLRSGFAHTHDCDARRLDLPEATFVSDPRLAAPLMQLARAAGTGDALFAESALAELYGALRSKQVIVRGGLAPRILRRIDDWIEAHLDEVIHLDDIARLAGLSGFHVHRMFRLSRGLAPHAWITARRVDRARILLRSNQPIAEIAIACGFSSQSHLTRAFRRQTGRTPAEYRSISKDYGSCRVSG